MNVNGGKRWTRAAVCAVALATPLVLSGCQSSTSGAVGAAGGQTEASSSASSPTSPASTGAATTSSAAPTSATSTALNGTAGTGLTVSDGSSKILINGQAVDFGTAVHDPAWSADGKQVLFIDGAGDLAVANADGTGMKVVAKNPGGQTWSHPTWWALAADPTDDLPARSAYFFASTAKGTTTLWEMSSDGGLQKMTLDAPAGGPNTPVIPQTGNKWPSASGQKGAAVYENDHGFSSDIYMYDDNLRSQTGLAIKNGSEPDYVVIGTGSGAVTEVVFVREVGRHKHVFEESMDNNTPARDLTPTATTDCTEPALSPDGTTVAFSTSSGVETVPTSGSATPTKVTSTAGFPAYRAGS